MQIVTVDTLKLIPLSPPKSEVFDSTLVADASEKIKEFYKTNEYKTAWNDEKNRKELINALRSLSIDGIDTTLYPIAQLTLAHQNYDQLGKKERIQFDFLYSENFMNAAAHLFNGIMSPKKLYKDWDIEPKKINLPATMHLALEHDAIAIAFDSIRPKSEVYTGLRKALEQLNTIEDYEFDMLLTGRKIKLNDSFPEVEEVKRRLMHWGDLAETDTLTPVFDHQTMDALKTFQSRYGLDETGLLDSETVKALNTEKEKLIQIVVANLERWRWYPRHLGANYVLVNIPDFSLIVVSSNDTVQKHKVIVGTTARKTPILSSKFNSLIINPTWTVPPTILKNDLTPAARKNRGYFASRGFTIFDSKGNAVDPEDWNPDKASSYRYVQKPGRANALGRIKFNFPNNHLVYLHDTNNKNYFSRESRNLSSGCVRVENPFELADYILQTEQSSYTMSQIDKILASEKTQHIPLKSTIEVHQFYWTSWLDKKGLQFRKDIYNYDEALYSELFSRN